MTKTYQMTQWDLGRTLPLNFPQAHFALANSDECLVVESKNNCVSVPNILLQDGRDIYVWIVENGVSIHQAKIVVKHKPKPVDYIYTETEILSFQKLEQKVKDALANLDISIQEVEELKGKVDAVQATAKAAINDTKAKAESAINEAKTSAESAINDAKYKADAALLKAQEAQFKADVAVDQANTSVSKAAQAVANSESAIGESKAAIQEVKNLSNKISPAAENILTGESKDKVVHIDDAFAGAALCKITVEGACKQDGIPSPDSPKSITVIEHPTVKVVGRNVLDFTFPTLQSGYSSGIANITPYNFGKKCISLPYTTMGSSSGFGFVQKLMPGSYTVKAFNAPAKASVNIAAYKSFEDTKDINKNLWYISEQMLSGIPSFTITDTAQYVVFCFAAIWENGTNKITYPADFKAVVEYSGTATEYKPYTSQTLTFTLPAEHPYLAKLPDGTADEIVVDEEGNVELVARVGVDKNVREVGDFSQGKWYSLRTSIVPYASASVSSSIYGRHVLCNALPYKNAVASGEGIYRTWNSIYVKDTSGRTKEEIQAEVDKNAPLTVVAAMPETRYPLGKIEMPKAQDSIVNVWTDAEITPNTSVKYTRDINIAFDKLANAIVASVGGES